MPACTPPFPPVFSPCAVPGARIIVFLVEPSPTRTIAGCMTGTSLDGLDIVLTEVRGRGLEIVARLLAHAARPLGELGARLRRLAEGSAAPAIEFQRAARSLGELHAEAIGELMRRENLPKIDFAVVHGQTIVHAPSEGLSWQLFDPWPIAGRLNIPVLYDLRQRDLIAGGEGAPITPLADWIFFRDACRSRLVLNLGGIANATFLAGGGPQEIQARDLAPCNLLIDGVTRSLRPDLSFDRDGRLAASGKPIEEITRLVEELPALRGGRALRSLGREDVPETWIASFLAGAGARFRPEDVLRSVVEAVAAAIARSAGPWRADETVLAGGGARNPVLVEAISRHMGSPAIQSDRLGIPCEAREPLEIAVLGALSRDGVAITLPHVTGSTSPGRAGAWVEA